MAMVWGRIRLEEGLRTPMGISTAVRSGHPAGLQRTLQIRPMEQVDVQVVDGVVLLGVDRPKHAGEFRNVPSTLPGSAPGLP